MYIYDIMKINNFLAHDNNIKINNIITKTYKEILTHKK